MSATGLTVFDETLHLTNAWLNDLMEELGWEDRHRAYLGLRLTLQALRDSLSVNESAQLAAQLPMLVRGIFFEGWHPAHKPVKERERDAFLKRVHDGFRQMPTDEPIDAEAVVHAVFGLLSRRLSDSGRGARHSLPKSLRSLWPEPQGTPAGTTERRQAAER